MKRWPKRFLTAEQKYEIWSKLLTGKLTSSQAAVKAGVDRSTIMTGPERALAALQASQPGRRRGSASG